MQLPQIPTLTVPAVVRALAELGIEHDPLDLRSLTIDSAGLTLEVIGRDPQGKVTVFGNAPTSHTVRVPWESTHAIRRLGHDG